MQLVHFFPRIFYFSTHDTQCGICTAIFFYLHTIFLLQYNQNGAISSVQKHTNFSLGYFCINCHVDCWYNCI